MSLHWRRALLALGLALLALGGLAAPAAAATITVTTSADENGTGAACSLREAIATANTNADTGGCAHSGSFGDDTIVFAAGTNGSLINLSNGQLTIGANLTITGNGPSNTIVSGQGASRVFVVNGGVTVEMDGLTVRGGSAPFERGGGIQNFGALTITSSIVSNNLAFDGGGISSNGTLTVVNSTFSQNVARLPLSGGLGDGGGISNKGGTLTVTDSTLSANSGGGIFNSGTATVNGSTLSGNSASSGGGIRHEGGALTVANSTLRDNRASFWGGGIFNMATLTVTNSTLSGNSATGDGGGGILAGENTTLRATILDNGQSGGNCVSGTSIISAGSNLSDDMTCAAFFTAGGDQSSVNLQLGPLADNGGPTHTHALLAGSPAIDAVQGACTSNGAGGGTPISADQRLVPRPLGPRCDAGAFELRRPTISDVTNQTTPEDTPLGPLGFIVGPSPDVSTGAPTVAAASNNQALVPDANLALGGSGPNRTLTITPAPNQFGQATIALTVTHGTTNSDTFVLTVTPVDDGPLTLQTNAGQTVPEGGTATITSAQLQAADPDVPPTGITFAVTVLPARGQLLLNNLPVALNGAFTQADVDANRLAYRHDGSEAASDSFSFTLSNGTTVLRAQTTFTFAITITPLNDLPVAVDDGFTTPGGVPLVVPAPGVLGNDSDPEGGALSAQVVANPANGTLALNPTGGFSYTPNPGFSGLDSFTYRASDGAAPSNTATVTIGVGAFPTLSISDASVAEGNAGTIPLSFTVALSTPSQAPVTVQFATADGTALAGSDFQATAGMLTFTPGGPTSQQIQVLVLGDTAVEPDETFRVLLSQATNAVVTGALGVGTIRNDDQAAPPSPPAPAPPGGAPSPPGGSPPPPPGSPPPPPGGSSSPPAGASSPIAPVPPIGVLPDISLTVADPSLAPGGQGSFGLLVTNVGAGPTTGPLTLTAALPLGTVVQGFSGAGWSCSPIAPQQVACRFTGGLGPGQQTRLHLTVGVGQTASGTLRFGFSASTPGDTNPGNNSGIVSTVNLPAAPSPAPPFLDASAVDKESKLSDLERRQKERTNRGGFEDERIEGDVLEVNADRDSPSVLIANRDGPVEVRLIRDAKRAIGLIKPGDYLEASGFKEHEGLFYADEVEIKRRR